MVRAQRTSPAVGKRGPPRLARARVVMPLLSVLLCVLLSLCYWLRPDACAAVTAWPAWLWFAPGVLLTLPAWSRRDRRLGLVVVLVWALYVVAFAEEPTSLVRFRAWPASDWQAARSRGRAARIVSLNCAGGDERAAAEVAAHQPDIVLLQESPGTRSLQRLGEQLFGKEAAVVPGVDGSILARGTARPRSLPRSLRATMAQAHIRLTSGFEAEAVSARLTPILFRPDLWSADAWRSQRRNRELRRAQVRQVMDQVGRTADGTPLILGGDLNAPGGDGALRPLQSRLRDTFREGGLGWGNTATNEMPILRIDQIWVSERLTPVAVVARRTRYSDHRLVVCDVVLR